jgi:hypothetical protein
MNDIKEECPICFEEYSHFLEVLHGGPLSNSKLHSICRSCLENLKDHSPDGEISCPLCRKNIVSEKYTIHYDDDFHILISVNVAFPRVVAVSVKSSDTICKVKGRVESTIGHPSRYVKWITCNGKRLNDDKTLQEYNITKNCNLILGIL